ncbi:MAG: hypothetical protein K2X08_07705 [Chlamydiales bacterium]|nr:hypothetical protein [Chlamydiales bacterium]MBY0529648.1 hypothetical protein [Rhabdochlamydiaceae bacterium]
MRLTTKRFNYFQLACIFSVPLLFPSFDKREFIQVFQIESSLFSILVGNLFLWLIGLGIISMSSIERLNAIENTQNHFGGHGKTVVALLFFVTFVMWFYFRINTAVDDICRLWGIETKWIGVLLGLASTGLSVFGLRLLKWVTTLFFPFFVVYNLYIFYSSERMNGILLQEWSLSFPIVISTILVALPGVVNLPTIFRHAKSRIESYLGLTLLVFLICFFEVSMLFVTTKKEVFINTAFSWVVYVAFIFFNIICSNILNLIFASACLEQWWRWRRSLLSLLIGLIASGFYYIFHLSSQVNLILGLLNVYISCVGVVLIASYLIKIAFKKTFKWMNLMGLILSCLVVTLNHFKYGEDQISSFTSAIGICALFYLCMVFLKESIWSFRGIFLEKK